MKTYKYSTKERAERVSKTLGCLGYHSHDYNDKKIYMPCKTHDIFLKTIKKEGTGKKEVKELIDYDGTMLSSKIPYLDPSSVGVGTKTTDQIVYSSRIPKNSTSTGWYKYYGESELKEENMEDAFGFEETIFMDYDETVNYFQKKLGLEKENAINRAIQQGKKPNLDVKTPKKIKNKKNFIDRLILKEKNIEESEDIIEDVLLNKKNNYDEIKKEIDVSSINPLFLRNIKTLRKFAKENNISIDKLIKLIKSES